MAEIWKNIPGFEGSYQVSSEGRVKSLSRQVGHNWGGLKTLSERILKNNPMDSGYLRVNLRKAGKTVAFCVYVLVALAFHGKPKDGQEVRHWNDEKHDNTASNILWGSRSENMLDRSRNKMEAAT